MRVCVLGVRYPPHHTGGYELHCAATVAGLRGAGHDVRVVTSDLREAGAAGSADPPWVHRELRAFDPSGRWPGLRAAAAGEARNARVLARHLREFRPDVVCFWRMAELSVSLLARVHRAGVPAVGVVCDPWPLDAPGRDPWHRAVGRLRGGPDWDAVARWVFVSRWLAGRIADAGLPLRAAGIAHAGLELERLAFRGPPGPWRGRLLYAGRLSALKGVDVAVEALARLPSARLTVCGHGGAEARGRLEARARELGVDGRLDLRPALPAEAMAGLYAEHDALLFPVTWAEPWGLVPLEAMAVGTPVIATGTGGSAEYLRDEGNALLTAPGDPEALAEAVRRLAGDAGLRSRLVEAGRRTAEAHPAERGTAVIARKLEEAVRGRASGGPGRAPAAPGRDGQASRRDERAAAAAH